MQLQGNCCMSMWSVNQIAKQTIHFLPVRFSGSESALNCSQFAPAHGNEATHAHHHYFLVTPVSPANDREHSRIIRRGARVGHIRHSTLSTGTRPLTKKWCEHDVCSCTAHVHGPAALHMHIHTSMSRNACVCSLHTHACVSVCVLVHVNEMCAPSHNMRDVRAYLSDHIIGNQNAFHNRQSLSIHCVHEYWPM